MSLDFLTEDEAREMVDEYMVNEGAIVSTQDILDSGEIPRLKGYDVRPGKVSDCIFGGEAVYEVEHKKEDGTKEIEHIHLENPPLQNEEGTDLWIPVRGEGVSTHDVKRGNIPFKDQILAENHNFMVNKLGYMLGDSQFKVEGLNANSNVIAAERLKQIRFENVMRAYMAKSSTKTNLYYQYVNEGVRSFCGHEIPEGLFANMILPYIMDTPSTKSDIGDESVTPQYLFDNKICTPQEYISLRNQSIASFGAVTGFLKERGILLADTKLEHGYSVDGRIKAQDEWYTMDSSRYWLEADYLKQLDFFLKGDEEGLVKYLNETQPNLKEKDYVVDGKVIICPKSYSKEFARGFSKGKEGYTDDQRAAISVRYIMGSQELLGKRFEPDMRPREERVIEGLQKVVEQIIK